MVFRRRKITDRIHSLVDEVLHILQKESAYAVGDYRPTTIQVARLEQRVLMSASPLVVVAAATADAVESSVMQVSSNGDSADLELPTMNNPFSKRKASGIPLAVQSLNLRIRTPMS